jgi:hypothetical protein
VVCHRGVRPTITRSPLIFSMAFSWGDIICPSRWACPGNIGSSHSHDHGCSRSSLALEPVSGSAWLILNAEVPLTGLAGLNHFPRFLRFGLVLRFQPRCALRRSQQAATRPEARKHQLAGSGTESVPRSWRDPGPADTILPNWFTSSPIGRSLGLWF